MTTTPRSVFELTSFTVDDLRDGAPAFSRRIGIFSSLQGTADWLRQRLYREPFEKMDERSFGYFEAIEFALDVEMGERGTVVYDEAGAVIGEITHDIERPWGGREPENCPFKIGDFVAVVVGDVVRVGVVNDLPPDPEYARRIGWVTAGDDVYLVGVVEPDQPFAHNHVPECLLRAVPHHWVDDDHYAALQRRLAATLGGAREDLLPTRTRVALV